MAKLGGRGTTVSQGLKCGQCGWDAPADSGWKEGDTVYHCEGGTGSERYRGEVHHIATMLLPICWHCGRVVGCIKCAGVTEQALCLACAVWVTIAAFVAHCAIVNTEEMLRKRRGLMAPQFDEYPPEFQRAYLREWKSAPLAIDPKATFKQLVGAHLPR